MRMIRTLTDKSCWTCKYLGDWMELLFKILPVHGSRSMVKKRKRNCGPRKTRMRGVSFGRGWGESEIK